MTIVDKIVMLQCSGAARMESLQQKKMMMIANSIVMITSMGAVQIINQQWSMQKAPIVTVQSLHMAVVKME